MKPVLPPLGFLTALAVLVLLFRIPAIPDRTPPAEILATDRASDGVPATEETEARPEHPDAETSLAEAPLFEPGRQPPAPNQNQDVVDPSAEPAPMAQPTPSAALAPPQVSLRGIMRVGGAWQALVATPEGIEQWLGIGSKVGDWTILSIDPNAMQLQAGGQVLAVQLYPQ